jgi:predicted nucleic acid-binding protein
MTYLLDTNVCIELLNARDSRISKRLASIGPREIRLCSIVKAELYHGAYKSGREKNLNLVRVFAASFERSHLTMLLPRFMDNCGLLLKSRETLLGRMIY